jgi:D-alanyl-D-alanine carboxypeptidase-like protein
MHELSRRDLIALTGLGLLAAGCGTSGEDSRRTSKAVSGSAPSAHAAPKVEDVAVAGPKDLTQPLLSSDLLIYSKNTLPKDTIEKIEAITGKDGKKAILAVEPMAMGQFYVDEQPVTYAAVDPRTFWRFTVPGTAHTAGVWQRVAGGEIAVQPQVGKELQTKDGYLKLGNGTDAPSAHVGAYAQLLDPGYSRQIDAVVNSKWAKPLGMTPGNAALLSMGATSPQSIMKKLQAAAGSGASIQILGTNVDLSVAQTAVLTGGSVAKAIPPFNYTANGNGTVNPDPAWVRNFIRTEQMPIIGRVTGNRVMLPQLRGALNEIVAEGLSKSIYQYGGCYVPRFIAGTNKLSFHSFGTAIDLNVPDNQRGTRGKMDPRVVQIFNHWGFAWGGTWHYTDPMHFELATLAKKT